MTTLVNRDWYIADVNGKPLRVRCLSQNYVLEIARVVSERGEFGEVSTKALRATPEDILALNLPDEPPRRNRASRRLDHQRRLRP